MKNWMTSASAVLSLVTKVGLAVASVQIPSALQTPQLTHYWLWLTFIVTILAAVCQTVIGFIMTDPLTVPVIAQAIVANGGLSKTAAEAVPVHPAKLVDLVKP